MSSVDELISTAQRLLGSSVRPAEEEVVAEDEKTGKTVGRELAEKVLGRTSVENAFHFYAGEGRPLWISSNSLIDFSKKIGSVDLRSIEYHFRRGDFEMWIRHLRDDELADRLKVLRETGTSGESLRDRLCEAVRYRCDELRETMES
ncbi:MAG: hypothetical protein OEZ24_02690 [Candidatus Bathyarchaeota archaeon]|nr:hypothetical protein [Candidatus Bathyarchaeota archaeon]